MASETEIQDRKADEAANRVDQRSPADLRRMEEQELRLAEQTDLPMVRALHREAARRWGQMAAHRERAERQAQARDSLRTGAADAAGPA